MPRLAHAPVAGDIAADPRPIRTGGYFCHPEVREGVGFHAQTARADPDLLAGLFWVQRSPFRPVMPTKKMTGHLAPHALTSRQQLVP